jgi:TetR/AcrR family transcriptional regulator, cholesterol catabolism regulator
MTAASPPQRETKAARTRRRIVSAASAELTRHGYAATSLRRIAAAAGLQLGSLYFHFASKDELVLEVLSAGLQTGLDDVRAALDALGEQAAPEHRVRAAINAHLRSMHANPDQGAAVASIANTLPVPLYERFLTLAGGYARYWANLLQQAQDANAVDPQLDTRALRDILFAAMNSTLSPIPATPARRKQLADTLTALVLAQPNRHDAPA